MKHADLISQMTLEEKVAFCSGSDYWHTASIERLGIPSILWSDGPHGIRNSVGTHDKDEPKKKDKKGEGMDALLGGIPAVCYPTAATTACSWDPELIYGMGELLGEECIAEKVSVLLGPGTNMKRSPLCGRNFEYFSEDPYLAGKMSAAFINGVQSKGIGTSLKHYAVNNQETRRMTVSAVVDERTLREIYLTAYEIAVKEAQPWTIMCMYNRLNGIYGAENKWLLTDVLRKDFGFEGMIVTDWGAENERVPGLLAGQNLEMPTSNGVGNQKIYDAVKSGEISEDFLDEMVDGVVDVIMRAKEVLADGKGYNAGAHHAAARKIAGESMVLLKNDDVTLIPGTPAEPLLPFNPKGNIAVIGPLADSRTNMPGTWSVAAVLDRCPSLVEGLKEMTAGKANILYAKGSNLISDASYEERATMFGRSLNRDNRTDQQLLDEALTVANQSDIIIAALGESSEMSGESSSRTDLNIPDVQQNLLKELLKTGKPVVLVLFTGRPLTLTWEQEHVPAILNVWFGGSEAAYAIGDALFGYVNPGGKLTMSFPKNVGQIPLYYAHKNTGRPLAQGKWFEKFRSNYLDVDNEPLYPFGYGLSYTTFSYGDIDLSRSTIDMTGELTAAVMVTNTGTWPGSEVVQLYIRDLVGSTTRPVKELKGFQKIFLEPGQSEIVRFKIAPEMLRYYNYDLQPVSYTHLTLPTT